MRNERVLRVTRRQIDETATRLDALRVDKEVSGKLGFYVRIVMDSSRQIDQTDRDAAIRCVACVFQGLWEIRIRGELGGLLSDYLGLLGLSEIVCVCALRILEDKKRHIGLINRYATGETRCV